MVFQKRMTQQQQQRRRRRPWLCGGGSDTEEVAVESTMSKTLNKKKQNGMTEKNSPVDSRTGSSSTGGDESSSSGNDSRDQIDLNVPMWKAENFLEAPLVEDDWWEDENNDDDDDESSSSDSINEKDSPAFSDGDDDDDDDSRVANYIMRLQQQYSNATQTAHPASSWENNENSIEISDSSTSNDFNVKQNTALLHTTKDGKRFCNRGLQTWYLARQKWVSTTPTEHQESMKVKKPTSACPIIPESFRKELKQCLIDRRQFELSQSIPLSCVINAYEEVWRENGCD